MDAKTTHVLVLLAALSLVCTAVAWAVDHAVFSSDLNQRMSGSQTVPSALVG
jgi:hypothetical protein